MRVPRSLIALAAAAPLAVGAFLATPAEAGKFEATIQFGGDWGYSLTPYSETDTKPEITNNVTINGFKAACAAEANGQAGAIAEFLAGPLNGHDGFVWDLGSSKPAGKTGAFSVKGPGAKTLAPHPLGGGIPDYDLDLWFFGEPSEAGGGVPCENKNVWDSDHKCYSAKADPDEKTTCVEGKTVRFVAVAVSINATGGPLDVTLTTPY